MTIWDKLKKLVTRKSRPDWGPDVTVHHPPPELSGGGGGGGGFDASAVDSGLVDPGRVETGTYTPPPPGSRMASGQNVDRYLALTIAQQTAREACGMDAGLPTIHTTEFQRTTVDDGHGHLVPGWEARVFYTCPGPPIA
ncbi:hypothetical protein ACIA3K_06875 [Micromonospora sp. NPDC051543]|uniref:hypothetical protein n=1 Tax=Micromonospora sp. NPDC051543 TaxID=3364287 RepID=UPI00379D4F08